MIAQLESLPPSRARREATRMLGDVRGAAGDPAAQRDLDRQATTMKQLGERFLKQHAAIRCKPSTQGEYMGQNQHDAHPRALRQRRTPGRQNALRQMADLTFLAVLRQLSPTIGRFFAPSIGQPILRQDDGGRRKYFDDNLLHGVIGTKYSFLHKLSQYI